MIIFAKICKPIDYKNFILQNVHPAENVEELWQFINGSASYKFADTGKSLFVW